MATRGPTLGHRPTFGELVAGLGLAFGLWGLVYYGTIETIGNVQLAVSGEEDEFGSPTLEVYNLSFDVGDTEIYYGQTLAAVIATLILALVALAVSGAGEAQARRARTVSRRSPRALQSARPARAT